MQQHAVPRQITTFEFKLIGFLTLKQFIYLVLFFPAAYVVYMLFPIPILNYIFAFAVALFGIGLAFIPINDRPLDVWVMNFFLRLRSPTQFIYKKHEETLHFLDDLVFVSDPHRVIAHIESKKKLAEYLAKTKPPIKKSNIKQNITNLLQNLNVLLKTPQKKEPKSTPADNSTSSPQLSERKPFITGVIKNHKNIPLPGILIYIKDEKDTVLRLLKSNPHGVFATFKPLTPGEYKFEIKDPKSTYFFDTINNKTEENNPQSLEFISKELI